MVTADSPPLGPGSTFGPYRIDSVVGVGGMGIVYVATDQRLGRRVALKTVLGHLAESPAFVERFQREAAALAKLESPHVVQIFDHGVHDGVPFIATQYAAGGDLGRMLRHRGAMPPALAAELCAQVAEGMRDAHRVGVIHRDVKPANVLLRDDRLDRVHVYLCDFGVALTESDAGGLTEPGTVPGTWNYLAPERIEGRPGSAASDVYAVGCLLWETLTGRPPYGGSDVEVAMGHQHAAVPQLPGADAFTAHANRILAGTLAKDPAERYQSASVLRDDLRSLAGIPSAAPAGSAPGSPPPPVSHHDLPTMLARSAPSGPPAWTPPSAPPSDGRPAGRRRAAVVGGAVAAVAVLAIGTGVVVAVLSGDDEPSAGGDPTGTGTASSGATEEPTETGSGGPVTGGAVRGDLDGNGYGDLALLTSSDGMQLWTSDGSTLSGPTVRNDIDFVAVAGDVDNDGASDIVKIQGDPPRLIASVAVRGAPTSPLVTPVNETASASIDVIIDLGDVDGDGNLDLVLTTPLSASQQQVDVALGDGTGVFAAPVTWYSGAMTEGALVVADADDDGLADLVHVDREGPIATLLKSTGSAFAPTGGPTAADVGGFAFGSVHTGDLDGDGVDEIVATTGYGPKINIWSWNGQTFDQTSLFDASDEVDVSTQNGFTVADVDGNGYDDVLTFVINDDLTEGVEVYLNDGERLRPDRAWTIAKLPDTLLYNALGQDANNIQ